MDVGGPFPVFGANGIIGRYKAYNHEHVQLVLGCRGSVGAIHFTQPKSWITGNTMVVRPRSDNLDLEFLRYALLATNLANAISGTAQPQITRQSLSPIILAHPADLDEQRRIVTLLDKAFAGIATATANAQKNLINARALFEAELADIFDNQGAAWSQFNLNEVGKTITGNTPKTADKANFGDFLPFIKPGNFLPDGSIVYDGDGLSEKGAQSSRIVPAGSALMVCIGATIGKSGYAERKVTANQQINAVIPKNGVSGKFLYYQFLTPAFQRSVRDGSGQATLPIISKSKWSNLEIRLPNSEVEQAKAVKTLDDISEKSRRLADVGRRKLAALTELKQSLLHKAFDGALT